MDDSERLEQFLDVLGRLSEDLDGSVVLVEGHKDVAALRAIGIDAEFFCVQSGGGPVKAAEFVWRSGKKAIIMTDWDRRGGNLAQTIRENLASLGVEYDDSIRSDLAFLSRPFAKDAESLDSVLLLLMERAGKTVGHM